MDAALEKRLKRQVIGKTHRFLAIAPLGFEQTLVREIEGIFSNDRQTTSKSIEPTERAPLSEGPHVSGDGKVEFTAKITDAWKAVALSRITNRILMQLADFKAENFRELEKKAAEIPWELYLAQKGVHIHVTCKHSRLYHSDAVAERLYKILKGAGFPLAPADTASATPSAGTPRNAPPQNIFVTLIDDRCTLWLDLAGEELYRRGHERFVNDAPLKETIAAAMISEALHFLPSTSYCLLDLMAGSGTFSLEAAYMANRLIPGICRDFALKHQPAFKEATWNYIIKQQESVTLSGTQSLSKDLTKIITSDISERAIEIIRHNVDCSPLAGIAPNENSPTITPQIRDLFSYTAKDIADTCDETNPIIVLNPPYGKRLDFDAPKLYTKIGRHLAALASGLKQLGKSLTVAILAPKDDTRDGAKYTCTTNLLRECPALSPENSSTAKCIATSHGGFSLNVFIAKI